MDTRAKNYPANYCIEKRNNELHKKHILYQHGPMGMPVNPAIPTLGYMPSHMNSNVFSNNPIEIESALFGINANNLVDPQKPVNPEFKSIQFKPFFETLPLIMPNPLVLEPKQRPFPIP
tara:strand:- start:41 stop:397 length:357 start_codon:yes stop_codon:yes gene_type:complete